jgi:hypothetical protein
LSTYQKVEPPKCPICGAQTAFVNKNCYCCANDSIEMSFDTRTKKEHPAVNIYGATNDGKRVLLMKGVSV